MIEISSKTPSREPADKDMKGAAQWGSVACGWMVRTRSTACIAGSVSPLATAGPHASCASCTGYLVDRNSPEVQAAGGQVVARLGTCPKTVYRFRTAPAKPVGQRAISTLQKA